MSNYVQRFLLENWGSATADLFQTLTITGVEQAPLDPHLDLGQLPGDGVVCFVGHDVVLQQRR